MTNLYYKRDDCRLCHSGNVEPVVRLMPIPIATPNFSAPDVDRNAPVYKEPVPLELYLCADCGLLQILHVGNPEIQYRNYVYTTSVSLGLPEHFLKYADEVLAATGAPAGSLVIELGSNDGTLLRAFKERGTRVLGVDPARAIAARATESGVETLPAFFNKEVGAKIREEHGPADIVIANNVFANIDDLDDFVAGVRDVLAPDGVFVFETQYGADVIRKNLLDTVYHEHLSYFNVKPLLSYFAGMDLDLFDAEQIWTKGGSIRVSVQHAGGARARSQRVDDLVAQEIAEGFYDPALYTRFAHRLEGLKDRLRALVAEQHALGKTVGGYGVSVGTTTLLPQFGLEKEIDFLVDDDPNKESVLSGPSFEIPVLRPDSIYETDPGAIVIFAWRYAEPIIEKHQEYLDRGGKFIVPLPDVAVVPARPDRGVVRNRKDTA